MTYQSDAHKKRNERISAAIEAYTKKHMQSKETARVALMAAGILDENGKLRPEFGGEGEMPKGNHYQQREGWL